MKLKSGHKTFDQQTNVISRGNIIAETMFGQHIRPRNEVLDAIGQSRKPGELQNFDLGYFRNLPRPLYHYIKDNFIEHGGWLYEFFHFNGSQKVIHGYILTDGSHNLLKMYRTGPTHKSWWVLQEAAKYVSNYDEEEEEQYGPQQ